MRNKSLWLTIYHTLALCNIGKFFTRQGQIQCSSSYANDEVVFPSYEMLKRLKNIQEVPLFSQTIYAYFPADFD